MLTFMLHHWFALLLIVGTFAISRFAFRDVHNLEDDEHSEI